MKFLLTSAGIKNTSIHDTLVALLGKPIAEASGPPAAALVRLLRASWQYMARYPFLLQGAPVALHPDDDHDWHEPIREPLERLIRRGQETGDFDARLSSRWLLAAMIALGEAAGTEVSAGRMSIEDAAHALERSTLRVFAVEDAIVSDCGT